MATKRATGRESNPVDDEFLHHLYRGGELLAAGKVIEAKDFLERAHKLQPKNEKGQNLLGLAYFKLGLFDRAAELYEMLVRDNPVDPTLRVNLGLVYLKTGALQRAVREFEVAVDLAPDHKKAHNYLGLALAQQGEYGRAREHFLQSGSEAMAEKMTRAIAGEGFSRPAPVQPAKERGFAELEGTEVVREQGGVPVPETPPPESSEPVSEVMVEEAPAQQTAPVPSPPPPEREREPAQSPPAAEDDWGAQFGLEESAEQAQEAAPEPAADEPAAPAAVPEGQVAERAPLAEADESPHFGAEGPVVVASHKAAAQAEAVPTTVEEAPGAPGHADAVAPQVSEDDLPVLPIEELSEDGLPVLTAEPENAEDLAAIAQHQPPPPPQEALPPPPPQEALPPPPPQEALAPAASEESAPEASSTELAAPPAVSEPVAVAKAPHVVDAPSEVQPEESSAASPASASPAVVPQVAISELVGKVFRQEGGIPILGHLAPALVLVGAGTESPFSVGAGGFSALVDGELLTRLDGLVAFTGQISFKPEMKRFRGRTTDKAFGEGSLRMVRASGRGVIFIEPVEKRTFHAVRLGDESAYFRDECVFAFEEPVMFENGRVPSDVAPDLDLVHLRGDGKVLLSLAGPLRSVPVGMEAPVTVPLTHLVGWQGNLTPRVVSLMLGPGGEVLKTAVELSGEGFALICLPVR